MHLKICDQKSSVNHSVNRSIACYTSSLSIQRAWHSKRNIGTWLRFVRRATRTTITCDIYEVFEQLKRYRRSRHGRSRVTRRWFFQLAIAVAARDVSRRDVEEERKSGRRGVYACYRVTGGGKKRIAGSCRRSSASREQRTDDE